MFNKIKKHLYYNILAFFKPEIIGSPQRFKNNIGVSVGISNTTHISNLGDNLRIGNNVFIGHFNYIDAYNAKINIGDNVQITNYTSILTHSTHNSVRFFLDNLTDVDLIDINNIANISIGRNTYIGPHSLIMPGTEIGENVIISAYSFVKGKIPDYSVVRGAPGRIVGSTKNVDELIKQKHQTIRAK
jgi:acetyltransferase-like isoleucine patch superfamily enzyme